MVSSKSASKRLRWPRWSDTRTAAARLGSLANYLVVRFDRVGAIGDVVRAIEMIEEAIRLLRHGHPCLPGCLAPRPLTLAM